ncbi:Solute carrier family 40 member 1 [Tetrabaena socialis]|uniref:Solute carrier family 40 member n=1 Tax=Tetrabaena socialis TaxID=47790 RepID=A0A2J8A4Z5_9CHLO|nr:Solute carrier family 40 member 1 [Tetrabaena socialis]|eukprot:PNH07594.1 Solute carrier family 40 member 1 [Tetrabaena socialis]
MAPYTAIGDAEDGIPTAPLPSVIPTRARLFLCTSYALAAWAWRSWEFLVALVLIELYPNSLLMVAAYGLLDNLARVVLGPAVGSFVDRHERLPGSRAMLRLQNACIGTSAAAALALLWPGSPLTGNPMTYWPLMWTLTLLGAASSAGSTGVAIAVEREAVAALCGHDAAALGRLNSTMRAIDLGALMLGPLAGGLLMTGLGPFAAAAGMAAYCVAAYWPEVALLRAAFRAAPVLSQPKVRQAPAAPPAGPAATDVADERTGLLEGYHCAAVELSGSSAGSASRPGQDAAEGAAGQRRGEGQEHGPSQDSSQRPSQSTGPGTGQGTGHARPAGIELGSRAGSMQLPLLEGAGSAPGPGSPGALESPRTLGLSLPDGPPLHGAETPGGGSPQGAGGGRTQKAGGPAAVAAVVTATSSGAGGHEVGVPSGAAAAAGPRGWWRGAWRGVVRQVEQYGESWRAYGRQPVLLPRVALALLYCTVLSLGFLMTSYLKWTGLTEAEVSAYRGVGALTGLAATAIYPALSARAGLRATALLGITYQLACLCAGVLPVLAADAASAASPPIAQVRLLVGGLVASRTGLWLYDLAVTQMIQEDVRQDRLGAVYGVQSSLQAAFEMASFGAGLASPQPQHFGWLMGGSLGCVAAAAALAWTHACGCGGRRAAGAGLEAGV